MQFAGAKSAHPTQGAQEHVLSAAALQHGYKESHEAELGISEAKEVELSLAHRRELWEGTRGAALQEVRLIWRYVHN